MGALKPSHPLEALAMAIYLVGYPHFACYTLLLRPGFCPPHNSYVISHPHSGTAIGFCYICDKGATFSTAWRQLHSALLHIKLRVSVHGDTQSLIDLADIYSHVPGLQ
ncbi:hypothetical protein VNO77_03584 [Canavalia gladiata]|uniref:Uncharacterized protein n=1 Tax=Canavalia gladiata TaxID=3824 RepID=A0AAN9MVS4_CANGL